MKKQKKEMILIVDDDPEQLLRYKDEMDEIFEVLAVPDLESAKNAIDTKPIDVVLTDVHLTSPARMDTYEGFELLEYLQQNHPEVLCVMMSADLKIETYNDVLKRGAAHCYRKPILSREELMLALGTAKERLLFKKERKKRTTKTKLPSYLAEQYPDGLVLDPAVRNLAYKLARVGDVPFGILGETGTGKEEVAKLLHRKRVEEEGEIPFVAVNCATLTSSTALSMLFGHKKGSFTGATETTPGFIGEANGGILFLDEIHTLPIECQRQLLRVLNDGTYHRLGDTKELYSNIQVVYASTECLEAMVQEGRLQLDLLQRIQGYEVNLLPLRERKSDIDPLIRLYLAKKKIEVPESEVKKIIAKCKEFYWQGNIRQLFKVLDAMVISARLDDEPISVKHIQTFKTMLPPSLSVQSNSHGVSNERLEEIVQSLSTDMPYRESMDLFERLLIESGLKRHQKIGDLCAAMGISRSTLDSRRAKFQMT